MEFQKTKFQPLKIVEGYRRRRFSCEIVMNNLTLIQFQYKPYTPPLGALYLAFGLEKENIKFDLKIYPRYKYINNLNKLYSFLTKSKDIVAIGCWSDMLPYVVVALRKLKQNFPKKIIILGGIGPTEVAEEILNEFEFIDFIIKGCGVYLLPKLIKKIRNGCTVLDDIDGLVYRYNNTVISNYYKGFYLNIPDFPAYHYINNIQPYNEFVIFTSFGCPYECTFCNIRPTFPKKIVYRDLNKVIEEIKLIKSIKKYKKFKIAITDETFVINRERVIHFCNLLRLRRLDITWTCYGRVDRMDKELLKIMSKSGCKGIFYGAESGSNRILKKIKKGFTIEEAIKILLLSKKYINKVTASFIYLFPFEKPSDFIDTVIYSKFLQSKGICVNLQSLTPVKNSEIYLKYKKNLFTSEKIYSLCHPKLTDMPKECIELIKNYPEIFYFYYFYNFKELNEILKIQKRTKTIINIYGLNP